MFDCFKKYERLDKIAYKYLRRGNFLKYFKYQTYFFFFPLRNKYVISIILILALILTILDSKGIIK